MRFICYGVFGLFVAFASFLFYSNSIHNQHFSNIAFLDKNIEIGMQCDNVYSTLEAYRIGSPSKVFIKKESVSSTPEWKHIIGLASTISVSDMSTPFDKINYYVFCNNSGAVLSTYLVGD